MAANDEHAHVKYTVNQIACDRCYVKFLSRMFLPILATLQPKISIWYFRPGCNQMGEIQKFSPEGSILLRNFAPRVYKVSLPRFFTHFGHPTAENSDSVLSTRVWPEVMFGTFDRDATRNSFKKRVFSGGLMRWSSQRIKEMHCYRSKL